MMIIYNGENYFGVITVFVSLLFSLTLISVSLNTLLALIDFDLNIKEEEVVVLATPDCVVDENGEVEFALASNLTDAESDDSDYGWGVALDEGIAVNLTAELQSDATVWKKYPTLIEALILARGSRTQAREECGSDLLKIQALWMEVKGDIEDSHPGVSVSIKELKHKWKSLMLTYRRCRDGSIKGRQGLVKWKWYNLMDVYCRDAEIRKAETPPLKSESNSPSPSTPNVSSTTKWKKNPQYIEALIKFRGRRRDECLTAPDKNPFKLRTLWNEIREDIKKRHPEFSLSLNEIRDKWKSLVQSYKRAKIAAEKTGTITWEWYDLMDSYLSNIPKPDTSACKWKDEPRFVSALIHSRGARLRGGCDISQWGTMWQQIRKEVAMSFPEHRVTVKDVQDKWNALYFQYTRTKVKEVNVGRNGIGWVWFELMDSYCSDVPPLDAAMKDDTAGASSEEESE